MNKEQLILWAAGFYEGEGTVTKGTVKISQVNKWPLELMEQTFKGTIFSPSKEPFIYIWLVAGPNGRNFIDLIYPYLSPKRQEQINTIFLSTTKYDYNRKHCKNGHEYTLYNTYVRDFGFSKECKRCSRAAERNRYILRKQKVS